jgi:hypothetical protein
VSVQDLIDLPALLLLVTANTTPVLVAILLGNGFPAPLDANRLWRDGRPLLGSHKTWRGLIAGTLATALMGALLSRGFVIGAAFGALALTGDLFSSFIKRRIGRTSGSPVPLIDQLPEALLPMIVLQGPLGLEALSILGTAAAFTILDMIASRLVSSPS